MAECNRGDLLKLGVPEEAVEAVLAAHEAALAEVAEGLVPEAEVQKRIDAAVAAAIEGLVPEAEVQKQIEEAVAGAKAGLVPEDEVQRKIDEAVAEAIAAQGGDYQALLAERDMLRTVGGADFEDVKPKFREQVYALLDRGRGAAPVAEQLAQIRERYEEYFVGRAAQQKLPRFGAPTRGSMPRGAIGAADQFSQAWGFGARRNG